MNKDNYKGVGNEVEKLVGTMKKVYFEWKLTEIIGKPKELWNNLKPYSKL